MLHKSERKLKKQLESVSTFLYKKHSITVSELLIAMKTINI